MKRKIISGFLCVSMLFALSVSAIAEDISEFPEENSSEMSSEDSFLPPESLEEPPLLSSEEPFELELDINASPDSVSPYESEFFSSGSECPAEVSDFPDSQQILSTDVEISESIPDVFPSDQENPAMEDDTLSDEILPEPVSDTENPMEEEQSVSETADFLASSGTCGDNLTWILDNEGTLTISGTGEMYNDINPPWIDSSSAIKTLILEAGILSIGNNAFFGCTNLTTIVIPSSVTTIGEAAFCGCKLTSVNIPDGVTSIGQHAFDGCSMTSVIIPDSVTSLGGSAFAHCDNLVSVVIPKSVTSIPREYYWGPFWGCSQLKTAGPIGEGYNIEFGWDEIIPIGAFSGCTALTSVVLPNDLTFIESYAFYGCSSMADFYLPISVVSFGWNTFGECSSLSSILYGGPESRRNYLQSTGKWSGYGNDPLFNASWQYTDAESGWDYCGNSLFWQYNAQSRSLLIKGSGEMWDFNRSNGSSDYPAPWSSYESRIIAVRIEEGATSIGEFAFYDLTRLKSLSIPVSITQIGSCAFYNCNSLAEITLPDSLASIGQYAFYNCMALISISVPSNVAVIDDGAFSGCSNLAVITLNPGLVAIGNNAFYNCVSLNRISIPAGVKKIGGFAFNRCRYLKDITIPDTVKEIDVAAFSNCISLANISIPANLESIAQDAFSNTGLTGVVIPFGVKRIGENAFSYCRSLKMISFLGEPPTIYGNSFSSVTANAYYPADCGWWEDDCQNYGGTLTWIQVKAGGYAPSFLDVADHSRYYYIPVYWAVENGITFGYGGPNLFSPDAPCTREQIVTFLWRLMKEPEPLNYDRSFTDVSSDKWYYKPIMWAASTGITTGYADGSGRFGIGDPCTREQCVTFLWRAAGKPAVGAHSDFTDVTSDRYYYDSISWAASKNITVGLNDGTGRFGVGMTCSRAMIVTFLYRYANGA